jgi:TonB family protein
MIQEMRQRGTVAASGAQAAQGGVLGSILSGRGGSPEAVVSSRILPANPASPARIKSIGVIGLPESAQNELLASLSVREGDLLTPENNARIQAAVRQFDEHLTVSIATSSGQDSVGQADIKILAPGAVPPRIRVGGNVQAAQIVRKVNPMYPALAKQARIQGTVVLNVVLAKDGTVQNITVESGHALLIQASLDAVRQWVYRPTLLNGNPVEISTQVELNFTLAEDPPPAQP